MDGETLACAARRIVAHRLSGTPIARMAELATLEAGYACQRLANRALAKALGPVVGLKIGGTAEGARRMIGVDEPILGEVFSSTVHRSGVCLPFAAYRRPGIETEIAVRLGRDLPARSTPYARDEVVEAVATIMAAIELVDDRYEGLATVGGPTLVADNACNAASILGREHPFDRALALDRLTARTLVDGREVERGTGAALMGHPLNALVFAVEKRRRLGLGLEAGSFVSLGTMTLPQWASGPARYRIEVEALGAVELALL